MLKIRSPVITRVLFWCLQFSLQDELHTGLIKAGASVGCGNHVLYVKLMTLSKIKGFEVLLTGPIPVSSSFFIWKTPVKSRGLTFNHFSMISQGM